MHINTDWFINDDTAGNCITTVSSADTCQLNSTALECGSNNFRASSCLCKPGSTDNRNCQLTGILINNLG